MHSSGPISGLRLALLSLQAAAQPECAASVPLGRPPLPERSAICIKYALWSMNYASVIRCVRRRSTKVAQNAVESVSPRRAAGVFEGGWLPGGRFRALRGDAGAEIPIRMSPNWCWPGRSSTGCPPVCRRRVPTRAHFVPDSTVPVPSRRRFMSEVCPVRGPAQVRCTDYSELIECDRNPNGTVPKLRRGPRERALRGGVRGLAARASGRCLFPPRGAG